MILILKQVNKSYITETEVNCPQTIHRKKKLIELKVWQDNREYIFELLGTEGVI